MMLPVVDIVEAALAGGKASLDRARRPISRFGRKARGGRPGPAGLRPRARLLLGMGGTPCEQDAI